MSETVLICYTVLNSCAIYRSYAPTTADNLEWMSDAMGHNKFLLIFEMSENIKSNKIVRLEPSSIQRFYDLTHFRHVS